MRYSSIFVLIVVLISALTPVQVSLQQGAQEGPHLLISLNPCHTSSEIFSGQLQMPAIIACSCVPSIPAPTGVVSTPVQHIELSLVIEQHDRPPKA